MATVISVERNLVAADRIVAAVDRAVRPDAVLLCGSRATGEARPDSDYDVLVVLPLRRIPSALGPLRDVSTDLGRCLGAPVTINPLPVFRLRRPGRSFLVWKAFIEGRILLARRLPSRLRSFFPSNIAAARSSYSLSGLRYLLHQLRPEDLASSPLPPGVAHDVGKALLHVAQLEVIRRGSYAPRLSECLALLDGDIGAQLSRLVQRADRPETWFEVRGLLLETAQPTPPWLGRALLEDAQFLALSRLAGVRAPWRVVLLRESIPFRLASAAIALALAVEVDGSVDLAQVRAASRWLAPVLKGAAAPLLGAAWRDLHEVIEVEWTRANPLTGL